MNEKLLACVEELELDIKANEELIEEMKEEMKTLALKNRNSQNKIKQFMKLMEE